MNNLMLFSDGSVNNVSKTGYGAYLITDGSESDEKTLISKIEIKRFENTSSAKLELQTLLWALENIGFYEHRITIYTDSQNIISLKNRREKFEENNYLTSKNKLIKNYKFYQEFFRITDRLNCEIIKVKGHRKSDKKTDIDTYFTLVDRASRKAMRREI
jgi:ribonuclease HI